jgi:hypothetical protein
LRVFECDSNDENVDLREPKEGVLKKEFVHFGKRFIRSGNT